MACAKHYNEVVTGRRLRVFESEPIVGAAVRRFFAAVLDELDDPRTPRICLMAGSLSTEVLAERELERYVVAEMTAFQQAFVARFDQAKAAGELPRTFRATAAAQILVTYLQGLLRVIGVVNSRAEVETQLETLLEGLGI